MMDTLVFWLSNLLIFVGFGLLGYSIYEAILLGYKRYKEGYIKKVGNELNKNFMPYSPEQFYKNTILAAIGMAIVGYLLFESVLFVILFGAIGYFLPKMFLYYTARKRAEKLEVQLVDALYVLSNSVSAGLTLPQACEVVSKQLVPPVSQEFGLLVNEIRLGVPFDKALENMAERLRSNNFDLLVTAILISRQTGGNIAEIFKKLAESIKEIMRLEAKVKALTAQGRMQAVVLGGMPFALAFVLASISPDLMQPLFNTPQGTVILFIAAVFWLLGIYFLRKVINIDI